MLETTAIAEETTMPKASTKASTVKPKSAVVWVDPDQSKMMFREVVMPMRI